MKTLAVQRVVPLRSSKRTRTQKIVRLHTEVDVRRQQALKAYWDLQKALGKDLNLARVGRRKGLTNGDMASQCLHGWSRLNEIWMLCFADELEATPQRIWEGDWPFPELTPGVPDAGFERLMRVYQSLSPGAKAKICKIIETDKRR